MGYSCSLLLSTINFLLDLWITFFWASVIFTFLIRFYDHVIGVLDSYYSGCMGSFKITVLIGSSANRSLPIKLINNMITVSRRPK